MSQRSNSVSSISLILLGSNIGLGEIDPSETVQRLTGFTGSCALLAITEKEMTLFVDARYTLQAQHECPACTVITCASASPRDPTFQKWLQGQENLDVVYDPRNFSVLQAKSLKQGQSPHRWRESLFMEPISDISKKSKILQINHYRCAGESVESKKTKLQERLRPHQALLVTSPESVAWLLNLRSNAPFTPIFPSCALVTQQDVWLCVSFGMLTEEARNALSSVDIHLCRASQAQFAQLIKKQWNREDSLLFDPETTSVAFLQALSPLSNIPSPDPTVEMRCVKTEAEVATARAVHAREGATVITLLAQLKMTPCCLQTEGAVARALETLRKRIPGYHGPSFASIVASGPNAALVHYAPSQEGENLKKGVLLMDVGGQYEGATTDLTRTICLGTPEPDVIDTYTRILKGHIALARAVFPEGTTGTQLDVLARQFLWQARKDYAHGTGHGVGNFLAVHEGPFGFSKHCTKPLQASMILSNEPGFYEPGVFGIRLENLMVVRSHSVGFLSFEVLTKVPFDPALIDFTQLTEVERSWLALYHQQVMHETERFLEDSWARNWLQTTCRDFLT